MFAIKASDRTRPASSAVQRHELDGEIDHVHGSDRGHLPARHRQQRQRERRRRGANRFRGADDGRRRRERHDLHDADAGGLRQRYAVRAGHEILFHGERDDHEGYGSIRTRPKAAPIPCASGRCRQARRWRDLTRGQSRRATAGLEGINAADGAQPLRPTRTISSSVSTSPPTGIRRRATASTARSTTAISSHIRGKRAFTTTAGAMPTSSYNNSNYFRDVYFTP